MGEKETRERLLENIHNTHIILRNALENFGTMRNFGDALDKNTVEIFQGDIERLVESHNVLCRKLWARI